MLTGTPSSGAAIASTDSGAADAAERLAEEELFETYLAARVQQALESLEAARTTLAADAQDPRHTLLVMQRIHELRDLREQFDAQRERVNSTRRAAGMPSAEPPAVAGEATSADFRATQAERAAQIMAAIRAQPRTCPSCQALLAPQADNCVCGWKGRAPGGANAPAEITAKRAI